MSRRSCNDASSALLSRPSGSGLKATHVGKVSLDAPRRSTSRVSFASMEEKDCPSSPDKCADGASEELPPSPCRGKRRSTYSFGLHSQSLGCEDTPVDGSDGLEAKAG